MSPENKSPVEYTDRNTWSETRFEVLSHAPLFILDEAHNPQHLSSLSKALKETLPGKRFVFLIGVPADRDFKAMISMMIPMAKGFICVNVDSPGKLLANNPAEMINECDSSIPCKVCDTVEEGIVEALKTREDVVAFGSLYLVGEIRSKFIKASKALQRNICIAARKALGKEEKERASHKICRRLMDMDEVKNAKTIFSYLTDGYEVDLRELHLWSRERGQHVGFPVSYKDGIMEVYEPEDENAIEIGKYGIRSPIIEKSRKIAPREIDVILIPCVGFDSANRRIGHGGGYYDRYLPKCPDAKLILVAFECQRLPEVATEDTDFEMGIIIAE